jgi:hypothetical protein
MTGLREGVTDRRGYSESSTFSCDEISADRFTCCGIDTKCWRKCAACKRPALDFARGLCPKCYMRDWRKRHRNKHHSCKICHLVFETARRDARYCSPRCRQRAYRAEGC